MNVGSEYGKRSEERSHPKSLVLRAITTRDIPSHSPLFRIKIANATTPPATALNTTVINTPRQPSQAPKAVKSLTSPPPMTPRDKRE